MRGSERTTPSWRATWVRAIAVLWLPALLPFVVGPLTASESCVHTYLLHLPVVPGVLLALAFVDLASGSGLAFLALAAGATLLVATVVALLLRAARSSWPWMALVLAALAAANALLFAAALRA